MDDYWRLICYFSFKTKMNWHQVRQNILVQNIAHSDTPGYRPHDLQATKFDYVANIVSEYTKFATISQTHPKHFEIKSLNDFSNFDAENTPKFEITSEGNTVVLEEQMIKVTTNQLDYQIVTQLYKKNLGIIRITVRIILATISVTGIIISNQIGLGLTQGIDPSQDNQSTFFSSFLSVLATTMVFVMDFHHFALRAIYDSYKLFGTEIFVSSGDAAMLAVIILKNSFAVGAQISAPFLVWYFIWVLEF